MLTRSRTLSSRPALIGAATLSGLALAVTLTGPANAEGTTPSPSPTTTCSGPCSTTAAAAASTLSDAAAKDLAFSREEERMARDLYAALAKVHGDATPMSRIATSEQRHFDQTGALLERYGLADPATGRAAGSYAEPELQTLYDDWYARGKVSPQAAYQVGVELEKRDIADLKKMQASDAPADVKAVYGNLLKASENHLAAYERAVAGQIGGGYGQGQRQGQDQGARQGMGQGPGVGMGQGPGVGMGQGMGMGKGRSADCGAALGGR